MQSCGLVDCTEGVGVWGGLGVGDWEVPDVGDSDGLGVGCAITDDIEPKSIIAAAVANLMMSPMRIWPGEFALKTDVLTSSSDGKSARYCDDLISAAALHGG
jgi:hypothetical protein